jgi:hypothetical protein
MSVEDVYAQFYRIVRLGQLTLSDGGGPLGFDISLAIEIDWVLTNYSCDAIIETGCHLGDSSEYFARCYSHLQVRACDISPVSVQICNHRLSGLSNIDITCSDSREWLRGMVERFSLPFIFLDAHWRSESPLREELACIDRGVICIHDFDIEHDRFDYDLYNGRRCDAHFLADSAIDKSRCFVNNPQADYPLPCLQIGRRSGRAFVAAGVEPGILSNCPYLRAL